MRIEIDLNKCRAPRDCRKCLELCPESVFMTYPLVPREPGRKAESWIIVAVHESQCTECNICVDACPTGAISLRPALS